jgi:drug/metabolite transporter (DMT)-like permease
LGLALAVTATITWAFSSVWLRTLTTGVNVLVVNSVRVPATGIFLGSIAASRGMLSLRRYRAKDLALVAVAGLVGSALGSLLYVYALEEIGAGRSALLNSLSPVFALPLAALFLNERITRLMVAGTALALAGAWMFVV